MMRLVDVAVLAGFFLATGQLARADEVPATNPMSGDEMAIKEGRGWYRNVCTVCHGGRADGMGERGSGADLRKFNRGFKAFVETVKKGRNTTGRTQAMPAWDGVLDDKTIYQIGAYVETLAIEGTDWKEGVR
jgi:mono/diheme cytochrome c family protein